MRHENMCDLQPENAVRDATGFAKNKCMLITFADANKEIINRTFDLCYIFLIEVL